MNLWESDCGCQYYVERGKMFGRFVQDQVKVCTEHASQYVSNNTITTPYHPKDMGFKKVIIKGKEAQKILDEIL